MWYPAINMSNECAVLVAGWLALVGAILGGGITFFGVLLTLKHAHRARIEEKNNLLLGLYQALHAEVKTLCSVYENGDWGQYIENIQPTQIIDSHFPMGQDYFVVYRNNTNLIGLIPDRELRQKVVTTYVKMMGMIDSINFNNGLLIELEEQRNAPLQKPETCLLVVRMTKYAEKIKAGHNALKAETASLLNDLEEAAEK